jgi:hypothetical protein
LQLKHFLIIHFQELLFIYSVSIHLILILTLIIFTKHLYNALHSN